MLEDLALEAENMKRIAERLKAETDEQTLDRFKIGGLLSEIFLSYEKMKVAFLLAWDEHVRGLPSQDLLAIYTRIWGHAMGHNALDADLSAKLYKVTDARYYVAQPQHYDDRIMKRVLYGLIGATDRWLALLDKEIFQPQSKSTGQEQAPAPG